MNYEFKGSRIPWILEKTNEGLYEITDDLGMPLCNDSCMCAHLPEEAEANGHLIAAAPELLEALIINIKSIPNKDNYMVMGLNGAILFEHPSVNACNWFMDNFKNKAIQKALNINQ